MQKTPLLDFSLCYNIHDGQRIQAHIQMDITGTQKPVVCIWVCACERIMRQEVGELSGCGRAAVLSRRSMQMQT